jgi:hypothetical protein
MYTYLQVSQPPSPGYSVPIPQAMQYGATATTALAQQPYGFVPVSPTIQPTGKMEKETHFIFSPSAKNHAKFEQAAAMEI